MMRRIRRFLGRENLNEPTPQTPDKIPSQAQAAPEPVMSQRPFSARAEQRWNTAIREGIHGQKPGKRRPASARISATQPLAGAENVSRLSIVGEEEQGERRSHGRYWSDNPMLHRQWQEPLVIAEELEQQEGELIQKGVSPEFLAATRKEDMRLYRSILASREMIGEGKIPTEWLQEVGTETEKVVKALFVPLPRDPLAENACKLISAGIPFERLVEMGKSLPASLVCILQSAESFISVYKSFPDIDFFALGAENKNEMVRKIIECRGELELREAKKKSAPPAKELTDATAEAKEGKERNLESKSR